VSLLQTYGALINIDVRVPGSGTASLRALAAEMGKLPAESLAAARGIEQVALAAQKLNAAGAARANPLLMGLKQQLDASGSMLGQLSPLLGGTSPAYQSIMRQQKTLISDAMKEQVNQIKQAHTQISQMESDFANKYGYTFGSLIGMGPRQRPGIVGPRGGLQRLTGAPLQDVRAIQSMYTGMGTNKDALRGIVSLRKEWANTSKLVHGTNEQIKTAGQNLKAAGGNAGLMATQTDRMNSALQRTAVSMMVLFQLKQVFSGLVAEARAFNTATIQTQAILSRSNYFGQGSPTAGRGLQQATRGMAADYGTNPLAVMGSMNTIFQAADISTTAALKISDAAHQAAVGTRTDIQTMTDIMMSAYNALNLKAEDMLSFSDKLIVMWKDGVLTFKEAGDALGRVFQAARLFGVTDLSQMDKIMAMMTVATKQGGSPARNMTALQNVLFSFTKPDIVEDLKAQGITFEGNTNFDQNMGALEQVLGRGEEFINRNFADSRTRRGLSILLNQLDNFLTITGKMENSAGVTKEALNRMMDDPSKRLEKLQAHLSNTVGLIGRDFVMAIDQAVSPLLSFAAAQDKIINQTDGIANYTGVMRGLFEVLSTGLFLSAGGAALGTLTGSGTQMIAAAQKGGFMNRLFGGVGRGLMAPGVAAGMLPATAYGAAGGAVATGIGAVAVAGLAATLGYQAYHQSELDRDAAIAGRVSEQIDKATDGMSILKEAAEQFGMAYKESMETGKDLTGEMVQAIGDVLEVSPELKDKYGIVVDEGYEFITVHGKMVTSIDELQKVMEDLTVDGLTNKLNQMRTASLEFLKWNQKQLWKQAKEQTKDEWSAIWHGHGAFADQFADKDRLRFLAETLGTSPEGTTPDRRKVDVFRDLQKYYQGEGAEYFGTVPRAVEYREMFETWMNEVYGLDARRILHTPGTRQRSEVNLGALNTEQQDILDKMYGEFTDEIPNTVAAIKGMKRPGSEDEEGLGVELEGLPKEAAKNIEKMKAVRGEIETQLKWEQRSGELAEDKVTERRRELEQQKILPLLVEKELIQREDLNYETKAQYDAVKDITDSLDQTIISVGYQNTLNRLVETAVEDYADAMKAVAVAAWETQYQLELQAKEYAKAVEKQGDLADRQEAVGGAFDWLKEQILLAVPEEVRNIAEGLIEPGMAYRELQRNQSLLQSAKDFDAQYQGQGVSTGNEILDAMLSSYMQQAPMMSTGLPPIVGPMQEIDWTDDWQGTYDNAKKVRGSKDKLCATFAASRLRALGVPVPKSVSTTKELLDWVNENLSGVTITDMSDLREGDLIFSEDPTLAGSPAGHVGLYTGDGTQFDQHGPAHAINKYRFGVRFDASAYTGVGVPISGVPEIDEKLVEAIPWIKDFIALLKVVNEEQGIGAANEIMKQFAAGSTVSLGGRSFSIDMAKYGDLVKPYADQLQGAADAETANAQARRDAITGRSRDVLTSYMALFEALTARRNMFGEIEFKGDENKQFWEYANALTGYLGVDKITSPEWAANPLEALRAGIESIDSADMDEIGTQIKDVLLDSLDLLEMGEAGTVTAAEVSARLVDMLARMDAINAAIAQEEIDKQQGVWSQMTSDIQTKWDEIKPLLGSALDQLPAAITELGDAVRSIINDLRFEFGLDPLATGDGTTSEYKGGWSRPSGTTGNGKSASAVGGGGSGFTLTRGKTAKIAGISVLKTTSG
jgi:hypothetical protein